MRSAATFADRRGVWAFALGVAAVTVGVLLHLPMFWMGRMNHFMLAGMPMGGDMLAGLTRVIRPYGNIACCGLAASADLATTVMPFIIRGLSLLGIASAGTARAIRDQVWEHLATDWKPAHLATIANREVTLSELPPVFDTMLAGGSLGRTVVKVA